MQISGETLKILRSSGWFPGRKVDISEHIRWLEKEGFKYSLIVNKFLEEFCGLKIIYPHSKIKNEADDIVINPKLISNYSFERILEYEESVNEKLTPIGKMCRGYMIVSMSVTGKVYAGYDYCLIRIGMNGIEALETLCEGIESRKVRIECKVLD